MTFLAIGFFLKVFGNGVKLMYFYIIYNDNKVNIIALIG